MQIEYENEKVRHQCTSLKAAKKLFGGNEDLVRSLQSRIFAIGASVTIKDIIVQPSFHFHNLHNKNGKNLEGYFAIDVKSRTNVWRIILRPLNENLEPFVPCNIDEIADLVKIVEIKEVSQHYE